MNELISIIINVYNGEKYIKKCIDSALNQTYKNIEIIIVNDSSTDKTSNIINKYKDKRIRIINNKKNLGLSLSRNIGIDNSKGKYLYFIDADDYIDNDTIKYLYNLIKKYNSDIATCNPLEIYNYNFKVNDRKEVIQSISNIEMLKLILLSINRSGCIWNKLISKDLFNNIRFPNRIINDVLVLYKLVLKCNSIVYSNQIKYYYLRHKNSILGKHKIEHSIDCYNAILERYNDIKKIYPDLIENDISVLITIVTLYGHNNKDLNMFLNKNRAITKYKKLFTLKLLKTKLSKKDKLKLILFRISKNFYMFILNIYLKMKSIYNKNQK